MVKNSVLNFFLFQGNKGNAPSISITALPGRNSPAANAAAAAAANAKKASPSPMMKPGQPGGQGKGNFVICEICDGYIKDLEQLRNHMQWIHKVNNFSFTYRKTT